MPDNPLILRLRGWLAWHLAKPWIGAAHDAAKAQMEVLESGSTTQDQYDYRLGVAMGKVSGMRRLRDEMWHGEAPGD